ncbi:hypothetical protein AB1N83_011750 [Pleurotus pulmonarius]
MGPVCRSYISGCIGQEADRWGRENNLKSTLPAASERRGISREAISGGASGDRALLARLLFPLDGQLQARTSDTAVQASLNIHDLPSHSCVLVSMCGNAASKRRNTLLSDLKIREWKPTVGKGCDWVLDPLDYGLPKPLRVSGLRAADPLRGKRDIRMGGVHVIRNAHVFRAAHRQQAVFFLEICKKKTSSDVIWCTRIVTNYVSLSPSPIVDGDGLSTGELR